MDADSNYWQVSKRLWEGKSLYILTEMPGYWGNVYMIYLWQILVRRMLRDVSLVPLLDKRLVTRLKRQKSFIYAGCTGRKGRTNKLCNPLYKVDRQQEQKKI